jgi:hypothetical protein
VPNALIRTIADSYSDATIPTKFRNECILYSRVNCGYNPKDTVHRKPATIHRNPLGRTSAVAVRMPGGRKEPRP